MLVKTTTSNPWPQSKSKFVGGMVKLYQLGDPEPWLSRCCSGQRKCQNSRFSRRTRGFLVSTITTKAKKSTSLGSKVDVWRSRMVAKVKSVAIHKIVRRKQQFLGAARWWDPLYMDSQQQLFQWPYSRHCSDGVYTVGGIKHSYLWALHTSGSAATERRIVKRDLLDLELCSVCSPVQSQ